MVVVEMSLSPRVAAIRWRRSGFFWGFLGGCPIRSSVRHRSDYLERIENFPEPFPRPLRNTHEPAAR